MSSIARKHSRFLTRSDINQAVQSQRMARGLQCLIYKVEGMYYVSTSSKAATQLIYTFIFHVCKTGFLMMQLILKQVD